MTGSCVLPRPVRWVTSSRTSRDVWLRARREGLGGSDVAAVVGGSPFRTPLQVWAEKTGRVEPDRESERMRWGSLLEDVVAREWARAGGHRIRRAGMVADRECPWRMASLDRVVLGDGLRATSLLEVKTTSGKGSALSDTELLTRYVLQVQWYLGVTGLPDAHLAVLVGGQELRDIRYSSQPDIWAELCDVADRWWRDHVVADRPPKAEAADSGILARLFPGDMELPPVELDSDRATDVVLLRQWRQERAELDAEITRAEVRVKEALGDATAGTVDGVPVVTWRPQTARRVDTARLRAEQPDVAEKYTTESRSRVLRLKETS